MRVTLRNGFQAELYGPSVVQGNLVGYSRLADSSSRTAVPVDSIRALETMGLDSSTTLLGIIGAGLAVLLLATGPGFGVYGSTLGR